MSGAYTIVVDQWAYEVRASEGSVCARHRDLELVLPRWSAAQHLDALRRHLFSGPAGLELDAEGYAAEVLSRTDAPVARRAELVPLALWWATRPELDGVASDGESTVLHERVRAQLRECTWHERMAVARHGLVQSGDGAAIDPVQVMEQLLEHVVEGIEAPGGHSMPLGELAGSSLVRLSSAVLDRTSREAPFAELLELEETPAQARELLELCRVLGRTPTQVFELPAAEVDLVRELMRRATLTPPVRATAPARSHAPLHDAPDAIVIQFGNGGST